MISLMSFREFCCKSLLWLFIYFGQACIYTLKSNLFNDLVGKATCNICNMCHIYNVFLWSWYNCHVQHYLEIEREKSIVFFHNFPLPFIKITLYIHTLDVWGGEGWRVRMATNMLILKHYYGETACPSPSAKVTEIATAWCLWYAVRCSACYYLHQHIMRRKHTLESSLIEYVPFTSKVSFLFPRRLLFGCLSVSSPVMSCIRLFRQESEKHKEIPPVITSWNQELCMIKWLKYWIRDSYYTLWLCHKIRDTMHL